MKLTISLEKQSKKAKELENKKKTRSIRGPIQQFQHPNNKVPEKESRENEGKG